MLFGIQNTYLEFQIHLCWLNFCINEKHRKQNSYFSKIITAHWDALFFALQKQLLFLLGSNTVGIIFMWNFYLPY